MLEFFRKTKGYNVQWKYLGLMLNLDKSDLDTIEYDNPKDSTACRMEMLHAWLKTNPANPAVMLDNALKEIQKTVQLKGKNNEYCKYFYSITNPSLQKIKRLRVGDWMIPLRHKLTVSKLTMQL